MHREYVSPRGLLLSCALVLAACGTQTDSRYVKSERLTRDQGGSIQVTGKEELLLAGAGLVVQSGALTKDTTLTLELGMISIAPRPAGAVASWGPSGTSFARPAKMTLPYTLTGAATAGDLVIHVREADGREFVIPNERLFVNTSAHLVTFEVTGFTSFQPGLRGECVSDGDCSQGKVCRSELCVSPGSPLGGLAAVGGGSATGGGRVFAGGGTSSGGGSVNTGGGTTAGTCPSGQVCEDVTGRLDFQCLDPSTADGLPTGLPTCSNAQACPGGYTCYALASGSSSGVCVQDCAGASSGTGGGSNTGGGSTTGSCPSSQRCTDVTGAGDFQCIDPTTPDGLPTGLPTCSNAQACPGGFTCYALSQAATTGVCVQDCAGSSSGTGGGSADAGGSCVVDTDCTLSGEVCVRNVCTLISPPTGGGTGGNAGCAGGQVCDDVTGAGDYQCIDPTSANGLPANVPTCSASQACPGGFTCYALSQGASMGVCVQDCAGPSGGGSGSGGGFVTGTGGCSATEACIDVSGSFECIDPQNGIPTNASTCSSTQACPGGYSCFVGSSGSGWCLQDCTGGASADAGVGGQPGDRCVVSSDCASNACVRNICQ